MKHKRNASEVIEVANRSSGVTSVQSEDSLPDLPKTSNGVTARKPETSDKLLVKKGEVIIAKLKPAKTTMRSMSSCGSDTTSNESDQHITA